MLYEQWHLWYDIHSSAILYAPDRSGQALRAISWFIDVKSIPRSGYSIVGDGIDNY